MNTPDVKEMLAAHVYADLDNERVEHDVVGLTQTDFVRRFDGREVKLEAGMRLALYMDIVDDDGGLSYVRSSGEVILNPYSFKPYKWCCRLTEPIKYIDDV